MRRIGWIVVCAAVLGAPAVALAVVNLTSGGGFLFDIQDTSGGELSNGTSDAYDFAYSLSVNGTTYVAGGTDMTTLSGRNVILRSATIGSLTVQRQVYVPASGGDYARYLDVVTNPGSSGATVTLNIRGNLGSDSGTVLYATSSGDASLTGADTWFGTDDSDASGDPSLGHVMQGSSPRVGLTSASLSSDNFTWTFSTTVPAGGRVALLTFAIQKNSRADATAEARRLVEVPDDALVGLDDFLDDIVNFSIAEPGAPRVRFDGPFEIDEGGEAEVTITVEDLEGDDVTWSWDTDDDGTFGEMEGATSYTIPAGSTDGDGVVRVGVQASDGTNTTERYRSISVHNVGPTITSSPDMLTSVGAMYRYQIEVDDPAGDLDPLTYAVTAGPSGMVVSDAGLVSWTPREADVTGPEDPIAVEVSVDDGDMGTTTQRWELTVSPNRVPTVPTPVFPIGGVGLVDPAPRLVVSNASDPDRDALVYYFEIDRVETFDSPDLTASGPVDHSPGYTFWYLPAAVPPGHYHWRVWVSDGTVETEPVTAHFYVVPDPDEMPDAGVSDDGGVGDPDAGETSTKRDAGGCSCDTADRGAPPPWTLSLVLGLGVWLWRSRRRALR